MYTNIDHVVVEEQPKTMTLDDADVVSPVGSGAAVHHHGDQVVQPVRVHSVIRLPTKVLYVSLYSTIYR